MTLPASFPISASQINVELGRSANVPFNLTGAEERALAGVPSGPISFSDFLGKSAASYVDTATGGKTFSGVSFGDPQSNRRIVCVLSWVRATGLDTAISGATIGGVSATIHVQQNFGVEGRIGAAVFSAVVPSGTSGTVSFNTSPGNAGSWFSLLGVVRLLGASVSTTDVGTGTSSASATLTVPTRGIVCAGAAFEKEEDANVTWSNITERAESFIGAQDRSVAASFDLSSGSTTFTASMSGATFGAVIAAASFS